jgi:GMP synthase (glutamine-hydrolysing)
MKIHFIQHVPFEDPAFILDWAAKNKFPVSFGRAYVNDPYPDYNEFDLLLIMGGPMSVNDEHLLPWLKTEKVFVKNAIERKKVVIGICLGAQLIASIFKATIKKNPVKEIGWFPVTFNDTVCSTLDLPFNGEMMTFHWHGETFDLPDGALLLASSEACHNQAFSIGNSVFGFQFHMEATPFSVERLITHCENELDGSAFVNDKEMISSLLHYTNNTNSVLETFMDWITKTHF